MPTTTRITKTLVAKARFPGKKDAVLAISAHKEPRLFLHRMRHTPKTSQEVSAAAELRGYIRNENWVRLDMRTFLETGGAFKQI